MAEVISTSLQPGNMLIVRSWIYRLRPEYAKGSYAKSAHIPDEW